MLELALELCQSANLPQLGHFRGTIPGLPKIALECPSAVQGCQIYLNIADSDNVGGGTRGGIFNDMGSTLVFKDQNGAVADDQDVKDSIVFLNHLGSNDGTLNNIAP